MMTDREWRRYKRESSRPLRNVLVCVCYVDCIVCRKAEAARKKLRELQDMIAQLHVYVSHSIAYHCTKVIAVYTCMSV